MREISWQTHPCRCRRSRSPSWSWCASSCRRRGRRSSCQPPSSQRVPFQPGPCRRWWESSGPWEAFWLVCEGWGCGSKSGVRLGDAGSCVRWVSVRWMETLPSTAGDALLMERAHCCDPAAARGGPCRRRCRFGRLSEGRCDLTPSVALVRQVDLAHHNTPACPYKLAPPTDSSEPSIVSFTPTYRNRITSSISPNNTLTHPTKHSHQLSK
jgi:hypothetical protein